MNKKQREDLETLRDMYVAEVKRYPNPHNTEQVARLNGLLQADSDRPKTMAIREAIPTLGHCMEYIALGLKDPKGCELLVDYFVSAYRKDEKVIVGPAHAALMHAGDYTCKDWDLSQCSLNGGFALIDRCLNGPWMFMIELSEFEDAVYAFVAEDKLGPLLDFYDIDRAVRRSISDLKREAQFVCETDNWPFLTSAEIKGDPTRLAQMITTYETFGRFCHDELEANSTGASVNSPVQPS